MCVVIRGQLTRVGLPFHRESQGSNVAYQAWQQTPLPSEPLRHPLRASLFNSIQGSSQVMGVQQGGELYFEKQ